MTATVPAPTCWLGALGVLPFAMLTVASFLLEGTTRTHASEALAAYGAVILSFLGGIHWGLAIAGHSRGATWGRLTLGILPSLVAWSAVLIGGTSGLLVLAASFALVLLAECTVAARSEMPAWYPRLRVPVTVAVVACLTFAALTDIAMA